MTVATNPFLSLNYEPVFENLGEDYYDLVSAAEFPQHILRFRNDRLLPRLGLDTPPNHRIGLATNCCRG